MSIQPGTCQLTAYKNCDYSHTFTTSDDITGRLFYWVVTKNDNARTKELDGRVYVDGNNVALSLTESQIESLSLGEHYFYVGHCDEATRGNPLPWIEGPFNVKLFPPKAPTL